MKPPLLRWNLNRNQRENLHLKPSLCIILIELIDIYASEIFSALAGVMLYFTLDDIIVQLLLCDPYSPALVLLGGALCHDLCFGKGTQVVTIFQQLIEGEFGKDHAIL